MSKVVEIGSTVKLLDLSNDSTEILTIGKTYYDENDIPSDNWWDPPSKVRVYKGSDSNPEQGIISDETPIARAILGKEDGDTVLVNLPYGEKVKYKIINVDSSKVNKTENNRKVTVRNNTDYDIREIISRREIKQLVHFTHLDNLDSIKKYGILPKSVLKERGLVFKENDRKRKDRREDCISLSVSQINQSLLDTFARDFNIKEWAIVYIKPEVLYRIDALAYYCFTNAANYQINRLLRNDKTAKCLTTGNAFEGMFKPNIIVKTFAEERSFNRHGKSPFITTDLQAEIMYRGIINREEILYIHKKSVDINQSIEI